MFINFYQLLRRKLKYSPFRILEGILSITTSAHGVTGVGLKCVTPANIHDSKGANILIPKILLNWMGISLIKADKGYRGYFERELPDLCNVSLECVKSNFGTSEFIPAKGRWVVVDGNSGKCLLYVAVYSIDTPLWLNLRYHISQELLR